MQIVRLKFLNSISLSITTKTKVEFWAELKYYKILPEISF
jgi:hypothetical protein